MSVARPGRASAWWRSARPSCRARSAIRLDADAFAFAIGDHDARSASLVGLIPATAGVARRPAAADCNGLAPGRRAAPADAARARRRRSRARAGAAGERRIAVAQPAAAASRSIPVSMRRSWSRCRSRRPASDSTTDASSRRFFDEALDAVRRVQASTRPPSRASCHSAATSTVYGVQFESRPNATSRRRPARVPLRGDARVLRDDADSAPSRPAARRARPCRSAGGRRHQRVHSRSGGSPAAIPSASGSTSGATDRPWYTVVGVVGDVKQTSLALSQPPTPSYVTTDAVGLRGQARMSLVVRARGDAAALCATISGRRSGRSTRISRSSASRRWTSWSPRPQPSGGSR